MLVLEAAEIHIPERLHLLCGFLMVKEWAYAGVVFAMTAALLSHIMIGDGFEEAFPSLLIMLLNIGSYILRPSSRRLTLTR